MWWVSSLGALKHDSDRWARGACNETGLKYGYGIHGSGNENKVIILGCTSGVNNKQGKTKTNWYSLYQENTHDRHLGDGGTRHRGGGYEFESENRVDGESIGDKRQVRGRALDRKTSSVGKGSAGKPTTQCEGC